MHTLIEANRPAIEALCRRFHVQKLEVFGSAARGHDFDPARSDADFLVTFAPEAKGSFATLLGLSVDLVERPAIEQSRNYIRRHILEGAEPPLCRVTRPSPSTSCWHPRTP